MPTETQMQTPITFDLNGTATTVAADPKQPLLDVLRETLDMTGTKKGCDYEGQCGACTVLINGRAVRACVTPVGNVAGKAVLTVEGLGQPDSLHPLQQAFVDHGAVQCGYCIPGVLMSAAALLERNTTPTRRDVERALQGNLCRCTGYVKIIDAVLAAASAVNEHIHPLPNVAAEQIVGGDYRGVSAIDKATGATRYAGDMKMPGMLHAKVLRSPHARAKIVSINVELARRLPGIRGVFTAADIPGQKSFADNLDPIPPHLAHKWAKKTQEPLLAEGEVRMVGEPMAIIVADDEAIAEAGAAAIEVTYQPLPPILDPDVALQPGTAHLHPGGNSYEIDEVIKGNVDLAEAGADICVETRLSMPSQDHVTLEPESMVVYTDEQGRVVVLGPTQQPFARRQQIAQMLSIPESRVRVTVPELGGSFGGRHYFWPVVAIALPAFLLKRPIKLVYTRREVFEATYKRHPFKFRVQVAARSNGTLLSQRTHALGNAGPFGGAPGIAGMITQSGIGPYHWPAIAFETQIAHTNGSNSGAFRGYGMPQGTFAIENCLDELAWRLNIDPLDLRLRNAVDMASGTTLGAAFDEPFEFKAVLHTMKPQWERLKAETAVLQTEAKPFERYGVGLAAAWYRFSKAGATVVPAQAGLTPDGKITLYYTVVKSGQGLDTVMSQLAAHEMGVPREDIALINGDTDVSVSSQVYGGCRSTYWVGGAVRQAARVLKHAITDTAAEMLDVPASVLCLTGDRVLARNTPARSVSLREVAAEWQRIGHPLRYTGSLNLTHREQGNGKSKPLTHFVVGAAAAQVRVNIKNGKIHVLRVVIAQDVGRTINPVDLQGQVEGAVVMELGATLLEEYIPGQTLDFKSYQIPRIKDVPEITVLPVERSGQDGPLGSKGIGEAVLGHTRAAIANAFFNATGCRLQHIPATPARVKALLDQLEEGAVVRISGRLSA
jgi:aldehyde oxidoreductase